MDIATQAKLLRVLDSGYFRPVGHSVESPFRGRLMAATNRDLSAMVKAGTFRADLYYRLDVLRIEVPAPGPSDIGLIARELARQMTDNGPPISLETVDPLARLAQQRSWPGGVRELRHALEKYQALADPDLPAEQNWKAVLGDPDPAARNRAMPAGSEESPPDIKTLIEPIFELTMLHFVRQKMFPYKWGTLQALGRQLGMTGAGAAGLLRRHGLWPREKLTSQAVDKAVDRQQQLLLPYQQFLRRIAGM